MTIEEEVFQRTKMDLKKIRQYGFQKDQNLYKYSKNIMNNHFRIDIEIKKDGVVKGKVFDLSFDEEYTNFRVEGNIGAFANQVKDEFKKVLKDIKDACFVQKDFIYEQSNRIAAFIKEKYEDDPEFEWEKFPRYATFKNPNSKKWYGIIMNLDKNKLDKKLHGEVEIMNIKLEPSEIENLLKCNGFYPAYHMNKKSWISIILDNTLSDEKIMPLIDKSYAYTIIQNNRKNEWIVPANPKYFDIEKALKEKNTITWKQSTDIKRNDIVYLYVAEPYSSIMYQFKVIEVNIPYEYQDDNLKIQKIMKMKLENRYEKGKFSLNKLKEYGIKAVRGPRYMPFALSEYIKKEEYRKELS